MITVQYLWGKYKKSNRFNLEFCVKLFSSKLIASKYLWSYSFSKYFSGKYEISYFTVFCCRYVLNLCFFFVFFSLNGSDNFWQQIMILLINLSFCSVLLALRAQYCENYSKLTQNEIYKPKLRITGAPEEVSSYKNLYCVVECRHKFVLRNSRNGKEFSQYQMYSLHTWKSIK